MTLAHLIHRIAADPHFAARMRADPGAALARAGVGLEPDEYQALQTLLQAPARLRALLTAGETPPDDTSDWFPASFARLPVSADAL